MPDTYIVYRREVAFVEVEADSPSEALEKADDMDMDDYDPKQDLTWAEKA
tara:strand:- start:2533 stop:2682 length:150 start_codon:yes stop_codon:yes gene_type:complete